MNAKIFKKLFAIALAVVMVLSLVACGAENETPGPATDPATDPAPGVADSSQEVEETSFPDAPITMVVPFDPGSGDTEARMFAQYVAKYLGGTIVATNISGGSGGVGTANVIQSDADGYTFGFASSTIAYGMANGNIAASPSDIQMICTYNGDWMGIFVPADSPFQTFEELVAFAKENPGELMIGGTNVGSAHHSFFITLENDAGIENTYIPYGGANDTVLALLAGDLDGAVLSPSSIRQYMETDGVRLLTLSTTERVEEFPDVPTAYELGYENVDNIVQFRSYFAPAGVPEEILEKFDEATEKAFNDPEYQKYLADNNLTPFYMGHDEAQAYYEQFVDTAKASLELMQ